MVTNWHNTVILPTDNTPQFENTITRIEQYHLGSIMQLPIYMASYATPVIHVWYFRCITCVEMQVYYSRREVSGKVKWRETTLITFDM